MLAWKARSGIDHGVVQGDLDGEAVEQRREHDREVGGVDVAELPARWPSRTTLGDRLSPVVVELLAHRGHLGVAHRLGPEVEPQCPRVG